MEKVGGLLNLLKSVPLNVKLKISEFSKADEIIKGKLELITLFSQDALIVKRKVLEIGGEFEDLGYGFGIITINVDDLEKIAKIEEIIYMELPKVLYTSDFLSNKAACIEEVWGIYGLTGKGVLAGFIDSGIDYTHPAFRDKEGNTRIEYICDLSKGGKVWDKNIINEALKAQDPYSIVNEVDISGHGTHVAGIASAGGNIDKRYYGAAYESSIAMVKMTEEGRINYAKSTQLMRGIKFLLEKGKEVKMPLVINLSFSTNDGAHNGSSLLEKYISTICSLERISFIVASGNEGDRAHHVGGVLKDKQNISINIEKYEKTVVLQLYKRFLDDVNFKIKNPQGKSTDIISIYPGYYEGVIGADKYYIYSSGSKPFDINGEIIISFVASGEFLVSGVWEIEIYSGGKTEGLYDIWMPTAESLNPNTKFLKPNPFNTLGIPATVENVISVGSYNYILNSISSFSGRGRLGGSKPDIVAPGEGIISSIPMGGVDSLSGTSMAAPHVAGAAALLMEWGIVKGNDAYMYGDRLKYFLLKGARRDRTDVLYPGPIFGYGELCLRGGMDLAAQNRYLRQDKKAYIVEYDGVLLDAFDNVNYAYPLILDERYAVVYVDRDKADEFFLKSKEIVYVEDLINYTLGQISPIDAANISKFSNNPFLPLRGNGVVVGIIDTGIDYLNTEFIYEDNTSRIINIWDQTVDKPNSTGEFGFGSEYTREEINKAIEESLKGGDPYIYVDSKDTIGHGTKMAGIIGARGKNPEIVGAAPDCEFAVVKLRENKSSEESFEEKKVPVYSGPDVILAVKYLYNLKKNTKKPMVIYIPLGTNEGAHDGSSILERYIDEISKFRGIVVVTGCGNEGDSETHAEGVIEKTGGEKTIELKVDSLEKNIRIEIWCKKPDKVSLGITSPSGEVISKIPAKLKENEIVKLVYEQSVISVQYFIPEEITGDELIEVSISNVTGGIWKFRLIGDYIVSGRYDMWIPQRSLLKEGTRFLMSTPYVTITVPSTAEMIISSGFYDQNTESLVSSSGKGYTRDHRIKPDIVAGGVNAKTTEPGGGVTLVSGSSVGAAVTAGAAALLLEWGIVNGNDETMYSNKLKTYLIRGAAQREGDVYPNRNWGYGMLDLDGIFKEIRAYRTLDSEEKMYIKYPKEIYDLIK
ncbi:S8 family serine peptidase [Haloimpatiens sp. FM7315]|uniref:S8 family serine peptidase n=1 Tax=Haloimpatiens sp. FM7315 TaxID=3298609 RepID=UPI00370CACD2